MAQSRLGAKGEPFIGDRAGDLGAWNKLQLGWLDYEVGPGRAEAHADPRPGGVQLRQAAGRWSCRCPRRRSPPTLGAPFAGTKQYFSGNADDLDNTMTTRRSTCTGKSPASADVQGPLRHRGLRLRLPVLRVRRGRHRLDGARRHGQRRADQPTTAEGGRRSTAPATAGSTSTFAAERVRRPDDRPAVPLRHRRRRRQRPGRTASSATRSPSPPDGATVFADGAETAAAGWTLDGFEHRRRVSSPACTTTTTSPGQPDLRLVRQVPQDRPVLLRLPQHQAGLGRPLRVPDGSARSRTGTRSQADNNTSTCTRVRVATSTSTPARRPLYRLDGLPWRARVQVYDAPFSLRKADSFTLHHQRPGHVHPWARRRSRCSTTPRSTSYEELPNHGVKLPAVGVKIRVCRGERHLGQDPRQLTHRSTGRPRMPVRRHRGVAPCIGCVPHAEPDGYAVASMEGERASFDRRRRPGPGPGRAAARAPSREETRCPAPTSTASPTPSDESPTTPPRRRVAAARAVGEQPPSTPGSRRCGRPTAKQSLPTDYIPGDTLAAG